MDFPNNSFDMIFCGFALFFFPNVAKALSEFMRVLKPKGTLHVSIWGKKPEMVKWLVKESNKMCTIKTLSANSVYSKERLYEVLAEASFENVKITTDNKSFLYPVDEWWGSLPSHGIRALLEQLSEKQLEELKQKAFEELKTRGFTSTVLEEFEGVYAAALKPLN